MTWHDGGPSVKSLQELSRLGATQLLIDKPRGIPRWIPSRKVPSSHPTRALTPQPTTSGDPRPTIPSSVDTRAGSYCRPTAATRIDSFQPRPRPNSTRFGPQFESLLNYIILVAPRLSFLFTTAIAIPPNPSWIPHQLHLAVPFNWVGPGSWERLRPSTTASAGEIFFQQLPVFFLLPFHHC